MLPLPLSFAEFCEIPMSQALKDFWYSKVIEIGIPPYQLHILQTAGENSLEYFELFYNSGQMAMIVHLESFLKKRMTLEALKLSEWTIETLTHLANDVAALDQTAVPLDIETNTGILPTTIPAPFEIANSTPIELIAGQNLASYVVANIGSRADAVQILHQFQIPHVDTDIIVDHDDDEDDAVPTSLRITQELARRMLTSFIAEAYERCLGKYREILSDGNGPSSSNAARMYNLALEYYPEYKLGDHN
ncbi:hypothetical protein SeLEV6574_g06483, partial [Synchytrium endobioticum]